MYIIKRVTAVLGATLFALAAYVSPVSAAVVTPSYLDIRTLTGDTGVVSSGGNLVMDATATSITTSSGLLIDIVDQDFLLTATYSGSSCGHKMGGSGNHTSPFANGTLSIGSLLTAEFDNLTLMSLGGGIGGFYADLIYTGGSLQDSFTSGPITGIFSNATSADFSRDFSASFMIAEINPVVVPLPAAFWLFGAGLAGLVGIARRRK